MKNFEFAKRHIISVTENECTGIKYPEYVSEIPENSEYIIIYEELCKADKYRNLLPCDVKSEWIHLIYSKDNQNIEILHCKEFENDDSCRCLTVYIDEDRKLKITDGFNYDFDGSVQIISAVVTCKKIEFEGNLASGDIRIINESNDQFEFVSTDNIINSILQIENVRNGLTGHKVHISTLENWYDRSNDGGFFGTTYEHNLFEVIE